MRGYVFSLGGPWSALRMLKWGAWLAAAALVLWWSARYVGL